MAGTLNKVMLIGNVGKDPEVRYAASGMAIAKLSIATSKKIKDKESGEWVETTTWHNVTFFNKLAEICGEYIKKGSKIFIEGSLNNQKWKDEKTGETRYGTDIIADRLEMLGSKGSSEGQSEGQPQEKAAQTESTWDDDIPF